MQSSTARAIAHFAFGILAALVLIAVIVPASIMAGIAAFAFGYLLGISNFAIGLVGVVLYILAKQGQALKAELEQFV